MQQEPNLLDHLWEVVSGEKSDYFGRLEALCFAEASRSLSGEFDALVKKLKKPPLLASLERTLRRQSRKRPVSASCRK